MIQTTATQTATGIRFEGEGFQPLVKQDIKDYRTGFETDAERFRFVFRYLNGQYWMHVDIEQKEGISIQAWEERPSGGRIFQTVYHESLEGEWEFEAKGTIMSVKKGGQEIMGFQYGNLVESGMGVYASEGTLLNNLWLDKEIVKIGTPEGSGEDRIENEGVVLYEGRILKGTKDLTGVHTFSIQYEGDGSIRLGTQSLNIEGEGTLYVTETCSGLTEWEVSSGERLHVRALQLEEGSRPNPILGKGEVGEKSIVSYPVNDRVRSEGTLMMTYKGSGHLFKCGNLVVATDGETVTATVGNVSVSASGQGWFVISWDKELRIVSDTSGVAALEESVNPGENILLTGEPMNVEYIDEVIVWGRGYRIEEMSLMNTGSHPEEKLFEASFDEEVSTKEKTFVEPTMAPIDGSPILVKDEEGPLRGVTFFDTETGEYRIWNEERFLYDGESDRFVLAYEDLDERFIVELRHDGETLGKGEVEPPYVRFILSEEEKKELHGKEVSVRYQLRRSYFVDYDRGAYDSYRVYLARNTGVPVTVTHEGNRFSKRRLATEVELNPMETTRSEGFMFLDTEVGEVSSFRVFMEPNRLRADGFAMSDILIQALDKNGTEVIGADLVVEVEDGAVIPLINREAVRMRKAEGTYQYRYQAPYIQTNSEGDNVKTHLLITDLRTGIGARMAIYLRPVKDERRGSPTRVGTAAQRLFTFMSYAYGRKDVPVLSAILDVNEDGLVDEQEIVWLRENMASSEVVTRLKMIEELIEAETIDY